MNFEPQKFFVGLIDFFAIWLPGALLTYLFMADVGPFLLGSQYQRLQGKGTEIEAVVVFLFASYLLGHFVFLLGSWVLDDQIYDPIRTATDNAKIKRLADGKRFAWKLTRLFAAWLIKKNADAAVGQALRIKNHYLGPLEACSAINAFQWSKARLMLEKPEALETVHRFEADSKFFRSLLIVLCVLIPWALIQGRLAIALIGTGLLVLAFWRYVEQRLKATNQAYWYVITLESQREGGYRPPPRAPPPTHAGGVVYREGADQIEYLLVQAKDSAEKWVLPKGHIEPEEKMQETAVREVREETGVWARVEADLKRVSFPVNGVMINVQFYLMEALANGKGSEGREPAWLPLSQALDRATNRESKDLLRSAERERKVIRSKHSMAWRLWQKLVRMWRPSWKMEE